MYKIEEIKNKILHGDILEHIKLIPDASIDLVVTSPPYNLGGSKTGSNKGYRWKNCDVLIRGYANYSDKMPQNDYNEWQKECLTEMFRVIKEDGAIFYNHKWHIRKGRMLDRHEIVGGFPVRQIIIWARAGGLNFINSHFLPTYEVVYLIAKPKFKLRPKANLQGDVWKISQELHNTHPAPFPVKLSDRIIGSTNAEIILDPFMGSGTTAISALNFNRSYIGIEKSKEYITMALERIQNWKTPLQYDHASLLQLIDCGVQNEPERK